MKIQIASVSYNQIIRFPSLDSIQALEYNFCDMAPSWSALLTAGQSLKTVPAYQNDVADIGRQVLADLFLHHYNSWLTYYDKKNVTGMNLETSILY